MISTLNELELGQDIFSWLVSLSLFSLGFLAMAGIHARQKISRFWKGWQFPSFKTTRVNSEAEILNALPFPVWKQTENGVKTFENAFLQEHKPELTDRFSVQIAGETKWFATDSDQPISFALPIDPLVNTEATLKRFMATLSTTFAHLTVGIAVFNDDNTLHLFNPALSELLELDATWLAMRPGMASFFDNLRENRRIPERRNFIEWRRGFLNLAESKSAKGITEQWLMPDGKTLQVTAQPHAKGAVAFLFEDISAQITVERQYRAETALNQAVLDRVSDAVVVLDSSGAITFANAAFDTTFDVVSTESFAIPSINVLSRTLIESPDTKRFWDSLRSSISRPVTQAIWNGQLTTNDGTTFSTDITSGPDGSTLVVFRQGRSPLNIRAVPVKQVG